jgi:lipopolysaccharide assembly outer membrane protein LptD (OstA)
MKIKTLAGTGLIIIFTIASASVFAASAASEKPDAKKAATDTMVIITERSDIDLESEEFTIPGAVQIELGDIKISAASLKFSNKTHIAELTGHPLLATLRTDVTAEAGKAVIDFDKERADLSGGCRFVQQHEGVYAEVESENIETDFGEKGWVQSRGVVKINYKDLMPKQSETKQDAADAKKKPMIELDEGYVTAGAAYYSLETREIEASQTVRLVFKYYSLETREIEASQTVRLEIKKGAVSAESLKGNLKKKKAALGGGIKGKIKDISFTADRIDIDYGKQEADIWGDVKVERDNGDKFKSRHVWVRYKEGERDIKASDGVLLNIKIDKSKITHKNGSEKQTPEGGKP